MSSSAPSAAGLGGGAAVAAVKRIRNGGPEWAASAASTSPLYFSARARKLLSSTAKTAASSTDAKRPLNQTATLRLSLGRMASAHAVVRSSRDGRVPVTTAAVALGAGLAAGF